MREATKMVQMQVISHEHPIHKHHTLYEALPTEHVCVTSGPGAAKGAKQETAPRD
jgi:hypothetical protein